MKPFNRLPKIPEFLTALSILGLILGLTIFGLFRTGDKTVQAECPDGYRQHYQQFCINREDEQSADESNPVRIIEP